VKTIKAVDRIAYAIDPVASHIPTRTEEWKAEREARIAEYRRKFLEAGGWSGVPPLTDTPKRRVRTNGRKWVYASDGRKWYGAKVAAADLGVGASGILEGIRSCHRVAGVWLGRTVEEAKARAGAGKERAGR
jgi:hypothetical protein